MSHIRDAIFIFGQVQQKFRAKLIRLYRALGRVRSDYRKANGRLLSCTGCTSCTIKINKRMLVIATYAGAEMVNKIGDGLT